LSVSRRSTLIGRDRIGIAVVTSGIMVGIHHDPPAAFRLKDEHRVRGLAVDRHVEIVVLLPGAGHMQGHLL
jgi:hypothetical protein